MITLSSSNKIERAAAKELRSLIQDGYCVFCSAKLMKSKFVSLRHSVSGKRLRLCIYPDSFCVRKIK